MVPVLSKLTHYYKKLRAVGISRAVRAAYHRVRRAFFIKKMRRKVSGTVRAPFAEQSIPHITLNFLDAFQTSIDRDQLINEANRYVAKRFDILGSGERFFDKIPWHEDIRLAVQDPQADCTFDSKQFYADIAIQEGRGATVCKDIKLPWELSRFHHLPVLGLAYAISKDMQYADAAKEQLTDWLEQNRYLLGVNWLCPMEVGIRATNWIIAWHWLQEPVRKDEQFSQRFVSSLREHMEYLEGNWEFYDGRTSNHYLSNLVGYFYLCSFFGETAKQNWCYRELLREFDWQVFDEGTSYEGSTRYHELVTELMVHAFLLAREMNIAIEDSCLNKLDRMLRFIDWCRPMATSETVIIGDDDSGSLLHKGIFGLNTISLILFTQPRTFFGVKRYHKFGLSISKACDWHVTLRHQSYELRQPSGHFHADAGSTTIAYKGIPIVVDPGSYLYTASAAWRNQFRSAPMHNQCYVPMQELDRSDIFSLEIQEGQFDSCKKDGCLRTGYQLFSGICMERAIYIDELECRITDWSTVPVDGVLNHFLFSPSITIEQDTDCAWRLLHNGRVIMQLQIPAKARGIVHDSWVASGYGKKVKTCSLLIEHCTGDSILFRTAKS